MRALKPKTRIARLAISLGLLAIIMIVLFRLVAPSLISSTLVRSRMEDAVEGWLGHDVTIEGTPDLSFWPVPTVSMRGITIRAWEAPNAPVLGRVSKLSARFSLLKALQGTPIFRDFALVNPDISVTIDKNGHFNWNGDGLLGKAIQKATGAGGRQLLAPSLDAVIGDVTVTEGIVRLTAQDGSTLVVDGVNGTLDWPNLSAAARLQLRARLRDQSVNLDLFSAQPLLFLSGRMADLDATLKSALITTRFTGNVDLSSYGFLSGDLELSIPNMESLVQRAQLNVHAADRLRDISLTSKLVRTAGALRMEQLSVAANGSHATGIMDLMLIPERPPRLTGTLAFDRLELWPLVDAVATGQHPERMEEKAMPEQGIGFDLRLSANAALLGPLPLDNAAISIVSNAEQSRLEILDSDLHNGTLRGLVSTVTTPSPGVDMRLMVKNIGFDTLAKDMSWTTPMISGTGSVTLDLHATKPLQSIGAKDMTGSLKISADNGRISGFNVKELRRLAGSKSYFTLGEAGSGTIDFNHLDIDTKIANGIAEIGTARSEGPQQSISLTGVIPYETGGLALSSTIIDATTAALPPLNLFIGGAWPNPILWPLPQGAPAPGQAQPQDIDGTKQP
ncbi:AsmA family protein [Rhizobium oryzicola]|uniref:AsmA family protein n=1 Tax=Rhizobium oryzicola TaxID=1232668 RepID=A0ABT8SRN1_9HYPH|nr:AsmA family protein [Rhizobium oryzicola]MDO1581080.1 AsmA family protein [Rhizobium oryzicola]